MAKANGASDLHLEPGLPAAIRVRGTLKASGAPLPGKMLLDAAHELIGAKEWNVFLERRSFDLSKNMDGVRCRINIMQTSRGIGMAIRIRVEEKQLIDALGQDYRAFAATHKPEVDRFLRIVRRKGVAASDIPVVNFLLHFAQRR